MVNGTIILLRWYAISVDVQQLLHLLPVQCRRIYLAECLCQNMAGIEHSILMALPAPIAYNQT